MFPKDLNEEPIAALNTLVCKKVRRDNPRKA
jgi:hypothetical protein